MNSLPNLFDEMPTDRSREVFETLLATPGVRIERIVSHGQASPDGFWFDQETHEWVALLSGAATLRLEGQEPIDLKPGDFINIPAHRRHRIDRTDFDQPTVWLAIHYG